MTSHQINNQLMVLLQDEILHTQNLFESLELESEALVARDTPALEKVTQDKLKLIHQLESIGKQRNDILASIDGEPLKENNQLTALWQELLTLAAKCQEKNRINGGVIEVGFRQSQQALDIIKGTTGKPELYNHSGQTTKSAKSSTLAQA